MATEADIEKAARAMHDGPLGADDHDFDAPENAKQRAWCIDMAKAALETAHPRLRRFRHWKRGTTYEVIGYGRVQSGLWVEPNTCPRPGPVDMREVVIYRGEEDGSMWVRPIEEFNDGRFEEIPERIVHKHLNIQGNDR
jgi:hypothetical protein